MYYIWESEICLENMLYQWKLNKIKKKKERDFFNPLIVSYNTIRIELYDYVKIN